MATLTKEAFLGRPKLAKYQPVAFPMGTYGIDGQARFQLMDIWRMRQDAQIQFILRIIKAPLTTVTWTVECEDQEANAWIDRTAKRFWSRDLSKASKIAEFGSVGGELEWEEDEDTGLIEYVGLKDVQFMHARPLQVQGKLAGISVHGAGVEHDTKEKHGNWLRTPKSFWVTLDAESGSFWGIPRIAGCWQPWREKSGRHGALDIRRLWFVKYAYRGSKAVHPPGETEVSPGVFMANQDYMREVIEKAETGSLWVFPGVYDEKGNKLWDVDFADAPPDVPGLIQYPKELDDEMLRGAGIHPEVAKAAETGSGWAGRSLPFMVFLTAEDAIADAILTAFEEQAIRPGVDANFGTHVKFAIKRVSLVPKPENQPGNKSLATAGMNPGQEGGPGDPSSLPPGGPQPEPGGGGARPWTAYQGPRGGRGWTDQNGNKHYGDPPTRMSAEKGQWITIGGSKGADGKRHGGSPVYVEGGRITKGHPSLTGKTIKTLKEDDGKEEKRPVEYIPRKDTLGDSPIPAEGSYRKGDDGVIDKLVKVPISKIAVPKENRMYADKINHYVKNPGTRQPVVTHKDGKFTIDDGAHRLAAAKKRGEKEMLVWVRDADNPQEHPDSNLDAADPSTHRQQLNQSAGYSRAVHAKLARMEGINPKHLHQLAGEILAHDREFKTERKGHLQEARSLAKHYGVNLSNLSKAFKDGDANQIKHFDEVAAVVGPRMFPDSDDTEWSGKLFDALAEGNPEPMSEDDAYEQAIEHLRAYAPKEEPKADDFNDRFSVERLAAPDPWQPYVGKMGQRKGQAGWKNGMTGRVFWGEKPKAELLEEFTPDRLSLDRLPVIDPEIRRKVREQAEREFPERLSVDASGHEHKGKGPGGGQFTGDGGGGGGGGESKKKVDDVGVAVREKIGKGNSGDVYKSGDTVIKSAFRADGNESMEGKVYKKFGDIAGIAGGKQVGDEIHVPFYKNIVSVDTIPPKSRAGLAPLIRKSVPQIYGAISALSLGGASYGDVLQFGLTEDHKLDLLDFSAVTKESPEDATASNMNHLGIFFDQFGLSEEGQRLSKVMGVRTGIKAIATGGDDFGTYADDIGHDNVKKLMAQLDGRDPKYAYYATNGRHVGIPGIAQTENDGKIKVILSDTPISDIDIYKWEITPVLHPPKKKSAIEDS